MHKPPTFQPPSAPADPRPPAHRTADTPPATHGRPLTVALPQGGHLQRLPRGRWRVRISRDGRQLAKVVRSPQEAAAWLDSVSGE